MRCRDCGQRTLIHGRETTERLCDSCLLDAERRFERLRALALILPAPWRASAGVRYRLHGRPASLSAVIAAGK